MRNNSAAFRTGEEGATRLWFSSRLLEWYQAHKRHLPWRDTKDPFKIWLSEIILQQTRVNQGLPYYRAFNEAFASIEEFAEADLDEILRLWQGLGYYSRARNMHDCARHIVSELDGQFPSNYVELQKLKGIGKYTAAAISSICYDEPVPAVDGNVFRVLARLFGISDDIAKSGSFKVFFNKAKELMAEDRPGDFNQAVMEFGATVCMPKAPLCSDCSFSSQCFAYQKNMIDVLPVKSKNVKIKQRYFNYNIFTREENVLIHQRQIGDIWAGLFEFDLMETKKSTKNSTFENTTLQHSSAEVIHQLTHQKLYIKFHVYDVEDEETYRKLSSEKNMVSVPLDNLSEYAVPKPIESFLKKMFYK